MPIQYGTTADVQKDHGVKMIVYSPPGYGKTSLIATLPGRKIIISIERGLLSLSPANQMRMFGKVEDIRTMAIESATDFREAYQMLIRPDVMAQWDSLAIDSVTEVAQKVVSERLATNKDGRKAYGEANEFMARYLKFFRDIAGKHILFICQQDKDQDETGKLMFMPDMPGKTLAKDVGHYPDEIFAMQLLPKDASGKTPRKLRCHPDVTYMAKDRSGALLELEEPNLANIIAKIKTQPVS